MTRLPSNQIITEIPAGAVRDRAFARIERALRGFEPTSKPRRRRPSIATLVKRAEKTGKSVTSITMPDGITINFGDPEPSKTNNPWLADIAKATKQ